MNSKRTIYILILILAIGIVGLTIAYFSNSSSITNTFNTNPYGTMVTEEFVSPDNWLPGTKTDKSLTVTNSGQVDEAVRISYTEVWTSKTAKNNNEEGDLPLQQNGNTAALIHFTNTNDWTTVTENGTTYRYYNYKLVPNNTTSELLDYVTFNPAITNSSNCTTNETNGTKTITCNSTGTGYDDATYKLTFTIETVQYDKYKEAWNTNINIAAMKPMNASELALKSNPIIVTNYEDGNVHEMYTFEHEATEQTPALTDYRYIGNDPYNYVYFNCDDLNNQNSETCEVWRIIGVFDVERTNPNDNTQTITERRMKLVRGSALEETMMWDDKECENCGIAFGKNEWIGSKLNVFLNEDFLTSSGDALSYGLKKFAQSQISDSRYYLGGRYSDDSNDPRYGSTKDMYLWERDTTRYNQNNAERSTLWEGKIALLYPSDYGYTYSKGVDDNCYNDPYYCRKNFWITKYGTRVQYENYAFPESGWIYNSNTLELNNDKSWVWFISPGASSSYYVFYVGENGMIGNNDAHGFGGIRPTLYLSSSVKIIDGDGSSSNPYKLSL